MMSNVHPIRGRGAAALWMRVISSQGVASAQIRESTRSYRQHDLGAMADAAGCVGVALGENHAAGAIATVTFWQTQADMHATEPWASSARERAELTLGGPKVTHRDCYQVALTRDLARVGSERVAWMRLLRIYHVPGRRLDAVIDRHRDEIVRLLDRAIGFEGGVLGINHQTASLAIVTFWSQQRSMLDSDAQAKHARQQITAANPSARALIDPYQVALTANLDRLAATHSAAPARTSDRSARQ